MERKQLIVLAAGGIASLVVGAVVTIVATGGFTSGPPVADRIAFYYSDATVSEPPLSALNAAAAGWPDTERCLVGRGRLFTSDSGGELQPIMLIYDIDDNLVGLNLRSAPDQPSPPWQYQTQPLTGVQGREEDRWALGVYLISPSLACGVLTPGARLGFD